MLAAPAGEQLTLFVYRVDALAAVDTVVGRAGSTPGAAAPAWLAETVRITTREGAGLEILAAARVIVARAGRPEFTMPDVTAEMRRRGTGYSERTIHTMISAHLCAEATGEGIAGYAAPIALAVRSRCVDQRHRALTRVRLIRLYRASKSSRVTWLSSSRSSLWRSS